MSGGAAVAVGIVAILLGLYLGLAPLASNESGSIEFGQPMQYSLPSWYEFPGGVTIEVSWTQGSTFTYVGVVACPNSSCTHVDYFGSGVVANGTGPDGTETFTAQPGTTYQVFTDQGVQIQVQTDYTVTYTLVVLILIILGIGAIAYGYFQARSHFDLKRI